MQKQAPSLGRIAVMAVFALSCFGLLLFLWDAFGGPSPLQAKGYRFQVAFSEATQLADQADVRISGVPVGKVVGLKESQGRTLATIQMKPKYAPVRSDARAILRLKTLLGETYVSLTPGTPGAKPIPENGRLRNSQVASTTELDEVLLSFPKKTREDYKAWFTGWAAALRGRGRDLNDVIGNLGPVADSGAGLLGILDTQKRALTTLVRDTGTTFGALGRQEASTRTLISAGNQVFRSTARRNADLQETFQVLPTFLRELKPTLQATQATAEVAAPLVKALKPVAPLVRPTLQNTIDIAPGLQTLFRRLDPVVTLSRTALPAATRTIKAARPLLAALEPLARNGNPIADYISQYRKEFMQMWMNTAAAAQGSTSAGNAKPIHYLRILAPVFSEALTSLGKRMASNRHNPYIAPGGYDLPLKAFDCSNTKNTQLLPVLGSAPPCVTQTPPTVAGKATAFPHLDLPAPAGARAGRSR